jgi:hypothetical protein
LQRASNSAKRDSCREINASEPDTYSGDSDALNERLNKRQRQKELDWLHHWYLNEKQQEDKFIKQQLEEPKAKNGNASKQLAEERNQYAVFLFSLNLVLRN